MVVSAALVDGSVIEYIVEMREKAQEELQRGEKNKRLNVEREKETAEIVRKRLM